MLGDMIDHVGIYGSRVAEALSASNVGLVLHLPPTDARGKVHNNGINPKLN